jgi:ribosome-associated protein
MSAEEQSDIVYDQQSLDSETNMPPRAEEQYQESLANAITAARIADELRGQNIVVLDLTELTSIVDFFVIVTGTSRRQMHAIADEVNRKLKGELGNSRLSIEGYRTEGNWILTDYGDVVLHVFTAEGRALYNLEQLWADAKRVEWQPQTAGTATQPGESAAQTTEPQQDQAPPAESQAPEADEQA